ncbi:hypothetical protein AP20H10_12860 [Apilactobacillus apinorum]|uniref:Uncharacterized protein n=1 Tax=Apilactobacillus apinorum TaxID=1218495 RepID=A0ABP9ZJE0_9LACO
MISLAVGVINDPAKPCIKRLTKRTAKLGANASPNELNTNNNVAINQAFFLPIRLAIQPLSGIKIAMVIK